MSKLSECEKGYRRWIAPNRAKKKRKPRKTEAILKALGGNVNA